MRDSYFNYWATIKSDPQLILTFIRPTVAQISSDPIREIENQSGQKEKTQRNETLMRSAAAI